MCLAIPGKLVETFEENGLKMGRLDYGGTRNIACLAYTPEAEVGQYVVVHAGFGISVINEAEAQKTYAVWQEMIDRAAEEGMDIFGRLLDDSGDVNEGTP